MTSGSRHRTPDSLAPASFGMILATITVAALLMLLLLGQ